jgi:poly(ADP-ribose) glycohydrolase ARH3
MTRSILYSQDKIEGMLFGVFLGDAIGSAFDGMPADEIPFLDSNYIIINPPTTYTDDTQMTLSVFEEMLENGRIDQKSLQQRFIKHFSPWRQYGGGMLDVIEQWRDGRDIEVASRSLYGGLGSYGDGAAMRVAPISAFFALNEIDAIIEQIHLCSRITHTHPYGIAGAIMQAYSVLLALNDVPVKDWMSRFFALPIESVYKIKLQTIINCLENRSSPSESAREIGNGSDALEAVPAAVFAALRNDLSFPDTVLYAVSMGGDADTIGAMAGAIAGARFGIQGIPADWLQHLENGPEGKDFIINLVRKAANAKH